MSDHKSGVRVEHARESILHHKEQAVNRTDRMRATAAKLRDRGKTLSEIGEQLGVSKQRVGQMLGRVGRDIANGRLRDRHVERRRRMKQYAKQYAKMYHKAAIARMLGTTPNTLSKLGVKFKPYDGSDGKQANIIGMYKDGLTIKNIATLLDLTPSSVAIRLHRYRAMGLIGYRRKCWAKK